MENSYIIKTITGEILCFYYLKDSGIVLKENKDGKWRSPFTIIRNTREKFTVTQGGGGTIFIFCQDAKGDIILTVNKGGEWQSKVMLKNQVKTVYDIQISPVITDEGISLIYNVPSTEGKKNTIVFQQMDKEGKWLSPKHIADILPLPGKMYYVQNVAPGHLILYFKSRTTDYDVGYMEITTENQGEYNTFITTSSQITDVSFLTTNDTIHILYVSKSRFSNQLIYLKKETERFLTPIMLWEGQKIENCLLFFAEKILYGCFISGGQLYCVQSDNRGTSFSKAARYKNKFCLNPIKAEYISAIPQEEQKFYCRQVYVDKNNISDIQMLPDLYSDFYNIVKEEKIEAVAADIQNEEEEEYLKLKNLLYEKEKQNHEKDCQLIQMTALLKNRNEQLLEIEREKKSIRQELIEEREKLLLKIKILEEDFTLSNERNNEFFKKNEKKNKEVIYNNVNENPYTEKKSDSTFGKWHVNTDVNHD